MILEANRAGFGWVWDQDESNKSAHLVVSFPDPNNTASDLRWGCLGLGTRLLTLACKEGGAIIGY